MKIKIFNGLIVLASLYVLSYVVNLIFVAANLSALFIGRTPSLSFASQLNFAAWGFPIALAITGAVFLMDAGYISFNSSKK